MSELKQSYIESELKSSDIPAVITEANGVARNTIPVMVSYPRIDSKLILQNMEEVLHTVKQQHKEKHRRKKELKKLAMMEAGGDSPHNGDETKTNEKRLKHRDREKRHTKKRPLQEKSTVENGTVFQESPTKSGTILHHFQRTPKKNEGQLGKNDEKTKTPQKNAKVANAFEVMMNARNKSIGSNTPGKESPSPVVDKEVHALNASRKLKLQEWAEQKGGAKRKLEEESRAAFVDEQLEQRAKRLKKMLTTGSSPKTLPNEKHEQKPRRTTKGGDHKDKAKEIDREKKQRPKSRARRLSSMDSVDSIELAQPSVDSETAEFLSKLNSPTKKRDSLLGYFPKKESPKEMAAKQVQKEINTKKIETPRGRGNRSANNPTPTSTSLMGLEQKDNKTGVETPSGRPRRSCAGKARYDYDVEESPTKVVKVLKGTPLRRTTTRSQGTPSAKSIIEEDCIDVIVLDDSMGGNVTPQGTPKKLAPLFVRSLPKPCPDPEILKARKAFLQSGVPEKLRIEQEKQKQYEQNYDDAVQIFPKIAHIRQFSDDDHFVVEKAIIISFKLESEVNVSTPSPPSRKGKARGNKQRLSRIGTLSDCTDSDFQTFSQVKSVFTMDQISLPSLANKRAIIKFWKAEYEKFPTFKCYNQMREKYRYFSAIDSAQDTEQVTESFVVTRRTRRSLELQQLKSNDNPDEEYKPPATAPNGELLFCEKYKPLLFEQVLVNLNPVTQLKEFLSNWSNGGSGPGSAKNSQNFDDSMDFNDSTCSNQGPSCNTVVLLGPVSSGKTNAVFALANEMNFNVLEINAGMRRTGKKLIQELQEATQSHQIRKDAAGAGSTQKNNLLKMSLNGLKSQMKRQNSNNVESPGGDTSNSADLSQSTRKCLILIEDADIVFEQTDAGFTEAIYTLAASSKRPVIIVATNPNCSHLQRLMAQNTIYFTPPNVLNISRFLSVLSLIENCPISLDDIVSLYLYNRRDLRKTLLELQFFIQSGGDRQKPLIMPNKGDKSEQSKEITNYFASPRKRQFSVELVQMEDQDNKPLASDKKLSSEKSSEQQVYMHRSLFEFYTVCQNSTHRIPFPTDFHMFGINLNEIFGVSRKLKETVDQKMNENTSKMTASKRKSKSPKKQWLTSATKTVTPLDSLCSFYENLSIASLLDHERSINNFQAGTQKNITSDLNGLNPNLSDIIAHTLLEKAINVNLDAEVCPYNLFDTPKTILSLCDELGTMQMRSKRARNLDYEPSLRSICRSEQTRSTQERRSTRFYHYLRTYSVNVCNFSSTHFDQACDVFQSVETEEIAEHQPSN